MQNQTFENFINETYYEGRDVLKVSCGCDNKVEKGNVSFLLSKRILKGMGFQGTDKAVLGTSFQCKICFNEILVQWNIYGGTVNFNMLISPLLQ